MRQTSCRDDSKANSKNTGLTPSANSICDLPSWVLVRLSRTAFLRIMDDACEPTSRSARQQLGLALEIPWNKSQQSCATTPARPRSSFTHSVGRRRASSSNVESGEKSRVLALDLADSVTAQKER